MTDRYLHGIPKDSRVSTDGRFLHEEQVRDQISRVKALNEIAAQRGQSLAQMALSWVMKDHEVTSVLIGASKPEQIVDNCGIVGNVYFTDEELKRIDEIALG